MFSPNLWCYPWDLVDEGLDEALDHIHSNLGANGISLATRYHTVAQLRPHKAAGPRLFHSKGGVCFQPAPSHYADTQLKPVVAAWLGSTNPLEDISAKCRERKIALHSWTVCCHSSITAGKHPKMACKNVFGDLDPTWVCPANPDVQAYLVGLVADLSQNYAIDVIELESPAWPGSLHAHAHEKIGPPLSQAAQTLLSLCFCESCRQGAAGADVDVERVAGRVAGVLEHFFKTEQLQPDSIEELADSDPDVARFIDWRFQTVERLIVSIKNVCRSKLVVYGAERSIATGQDPARIKAHVDGLMAFAYSPEPAAVEAAHKDLVALFGDRHDAMALGLDATHPASPNAQAIVRTATRAAELGLCHVNIYNYGLLTDERLTWVRQAIRAARRAAPK